MKFAFSGSKPIYEQIEDYFRSLTISGVMKPGEKLPSVRELATGMSINPNTIQRAYRELENEGYIYSIPGKGSFVSERKDLSDELRRNLEQKFTDIVHEMVYAGFHRDEIFKLLENNIVVSGGKI